MKKISLVLLSVLLCCFVFFNKTAMADVSDSNYKTVNISNSRFTEGKYFIKRFKNIKEQNFIVGDKLSDYMVVGNLFYDNTDWPSVLQWESPDYQIKEGYQEVYLICSDPEYARITFGITGVKSIDTTNDPTITPIPTIEDPVTSSPSVEAQDTSPTLAKSTVTVKPKAKYKIKVVDLPDGYTYSFTSSNNKVATVGTKNGVVTGKVKGKAVIKCTITTPDNQKITLKCVIVVK